VPTVSAPAPVLAGRPEPVGGPWVTCYGPFRPTSTAERDVTRLGLLCGPPNGMKLHEPTLRGHAVAEAVAEHPFAATAGDCYRIFAVAEGPVTDLSVEVLGPGRQRVAADANNDRWPVLDPEGPFCVTESGSHTVRVQARTGHGPFALQIWKL
jgi:hypothetical protein